LVLPLLSLLANGTGSTSTLAREDRATQTDDRVHAWRST
jgi:hypothetical protein